MKTLRIIYKCVVDGATMTSRDFVKEDFSIMKDVIVIGNRAYFKNADGIEYMLNLDNVLLIEIEHK